MRRYFRNCTPEERRKNKENYLKVKPGINLFDFV